MKSKIAEAVRAMYEHPHEGPGVFRVSPDTTKATKKLNAIQAGTPPEEPFLSIWRAAPGQLKLWAVGRLSASDPKAAAELMDDVPANDTWFLGELGARATYLMADESGQVVNPSTALPVDGVAMDRTGNVVDAETGALVEMG